jgi:hypothetical protein
MKIEMAHPLKSVQLSGDLPAPQISETYAALISRKVLVSSAATPYFAIEQHMFFRLMEIALECIDVDEDWYIARNSDVAEAVRNGSISSAAYHYRRFGFYEHRMPYAIEVAEAWYLQSYADVEDGLFRKVYPSAQSHFETVGFREGRLPYPDFSLGVRKSAATILHLPRIALLARHEQPAA